MSRKAERWAELAVLAVLTVVAFGPLAAMLRHAHEAGLVFSGADGPFAGDQFQYFAWIREYAGGPLADNDLDLAPSADVFPHPLFGLSGLATRLGLSVPVAFLLWKPVAIAVLFLGVRAYLGRFVPGRPERVVALALALLFASPAVLLGDDTLAAAGEMFPGALLWGYLPAAIAVGLMPLFLLGVERLARPGDGRPRPREVAAVAACGALAAWLHPWQGQVLLVCVVAALALDRREDRSLLGPAIACAATLVPLLGYFVLSLADASWSMAAEANEAIGDPPLWTVALALAPLAAVAAAGLRWPPADLGESLVLAWAPASLLVTAFLSPSFAQHALEGISIPLAILAVRGWGRLRGRAPRAAPVVAAVVVVSLVVPGAIRFADWLRDTVSAPGQAHYLEPGERDALEHLDALRDPGGVLTSARLGALVPSATGRRTWLGHPSWTRDYAQRADEAGALFGGGLTPAAVDGLLGASGARFVLADCGTAPAARGALERTAGSTRTFGCATVYRLGPSS